MLFTTASTRFDAPTPVLFPAATVPTTPISLNVLDAETFTYCSVEVFD